MQINLTAEEVRERLHYAVATEFEVVVIGEVVLHSGGGATITVDSGRFVDEVEDIDVEVTE